MSNPKAICFNCNKWLCQHFDGRFCYPNWKMDVFSDRPSSAQIVAYMQKYKFDILSDVINKLRELNGIDKYV